MVSIQSLARYGQALYAVIAATERSLVFLAALALTAGKVCLDKARGTLDHIVVVTAHPLADQPGPRFHRGLCLTAITFHYPSPSGDRMAWPVEPLFPRYRTLHKPKCH
jgi:hypothetical protein